MIRQQIPDLFKDYSETDLGNYTIDFKMMPFYDRDAVEEKGTLFNTIQANCIITSKVTEETHSFTLDLLKIPIYTEAGFKIKNNHIQILDSYDRATGWVFQSDYSEDAESSTDNFDKRTATLIGTNYTALTFTYKKTGGIGVLCKKKYVPIKIFLRVLTGMSAEELIELYGYNNAYVVNSFFPATIKKGIPHEKSSRDRFINYFHDLIYPDVKGSNKLLSVNDKLRKIKRSYFDIRYLNLGSDYSERLEHSMSFSFNAEGKELAEDIVLDGEVLYKRGLVLTSDVLEKLDNLPITHIVVKFGKLYDLYKFSTFTFRALGYKLAEEYCNIPAGKELTMSDLEILNNSDLDTIRVTNKFKKTIELKRRVRPRTLSVDDILTVFNLYANIINGFDVSDNQYELTNRVVMPFNMKVLRILESHLSQYIRALESAAQTKSAEELVLDVVAKSDIDLDEFIQQVSNPDDADAQMADMNNSLHYISKCYKVTTDVAASQATENIRRVQDLQLGRLDSIDSPESNKIGLVHQRTLLAREDSNGYLTTPYLKVEKGKIVSTEPVYLTAQEEYGHYIAEWNETFYKDVDGEQVLKDYVRARLNGNIVTIESDKVTYKEYTQIQNMSAARALIPFMGNSNAKRLLMACNHGKQAVPTIHMEPPIVGTGGEFMIPTGNYIASEVLKKYYYESVEIFPDLAKYKDKILNGSLSIDLGGIRTVNNTRVIRLVVNEAKELYDAWDINCDYTTNITIPFMQKTSEKSIFSFKINANPNNIYRGKDVIACNIAVYTNKKKAVSVGDYGGLEIDEDLLSQSYGPGVNLTVGYKTFASSSIDDAICISSRLVYDETLTSITIVSKKAELHSSEEKTENFGMPSDSWKYQLDARGLAKVGAILSPGEVYASIISVKNGKTNCQLKYLDEYTQGQVISSEIKEDIEGNIYAEIILATRSDIEPGDKMAGRCGNKGVVARIIPEWEMPYDPKTGLTLDVILNPLGIPSRMNITQLLESNLALALARKGERVVLAPFYDKSIDYVHEQMESQNTYPMTLIDGRTGLPFKRPINVGKQYMLKLVHQVKKKTNAISMEEPTDPIFQQPLKGQKNEGGQSFGEMEAWCLQGVGAKKLLQNTYSSSSDDVDKKIELTKNFLYGDAAYGNADFVGENHNDLVMQAFTRSLGIDIDVVDGMYTFKPLTDAKIRSLSIFSVSGENDLHSPNIFGTCKSPLQKMNGKKYWSYVDLHTEIVSPFWFHKGMLNKFIFVKNVDQTAEGPKIRGRVPASAELFWDLLNKTKYVARTISQCGFPTIYNNKIEELPRDLITGNEAILYIFKNYDLQNSVTAYEEDIAKIKKKAKIEGVDYTEDILDKVKSLKTIKDSIAANISLTDYVISSFPVMPQTFRPLMEGASRNRTSDFDKSYKQIINDARSISNGVTEENVKALLQDIEQFLGYNKLASSNLSGDKDRTNVIKWFTGSGDTSSAKHHGKIRENTLSKKMFCAGRSVIIPTSDMDMLPTQVGVPLMMLVKLYKLPLIGVLIKKLKMTTLGYSNPKLGFWKQLFNALSTENRKVFENLYKSSLNGFCVDPDSKTGEVLSPQKAFEVFKKIIIEYLEDDQVVELGRQPSLHQFSIRAFKIKVVFTKAIQIHPLVCSGYNADFDGDTVWLKAILDPKARKEALAKIAPDCTYFNPKDSSLVMMPAQDIVLGLYAATMLKNNAADIYENPEILEDVRWYSDVKRLETDVELGYVEYYSLVVFKDKASGRYYYSTAGRILFNAIIPGTFTDQPFSNPLNLPVPKGCENSDFSSISELKYDGIIAGKGGTRNDIKYCKLSKICEDFIRNYQEQAIKIYQGITKFGFKSSDFNSVSLSLLDVKVDIQPQKLQEEYVHKMDLFNTEFKNGTLPKDRYNSKCKSVKAMLNDALAGDLANNTDVEIKESVLKEADEKRKELEQAYQLGLVSANGRKAGIQKMYKDASSKIKTALPAAMSRNNNLFIIYDSGSRGNIGQIMQISGCIGMLQKTKHEDMEMPVTGNYTDGISSFDTHITSYSARTGVASTQNETQNAGHATRTAVYMLDGLNIVEDNCHKENWWYDISYGDFKNEVRLRPSNEYIEKNFVGYKFDYTDKETKNFMFSKSADGDITEDAISYLQTKGFSTLALINKEGEKRYIDIDLSSLKGAKVSEDDRSTQRALKNYLKRGRITSKSLEIITTMRLKHVTTDLGTYELFYELAPIVKSLLLGREASEVDLGDAKGLPYLEEVDDPNVNYKRFGHAKIKCITEDTIKWIETNRPERVAARILLDCQSKGGVCAHCFGKKYTNGKIPLVGENVGIEAAQAIGEPAAQLTMSLFHKGGAAGGSVVGGVEMFGHLLSGTNPGGKNADSAIISPRDGYVKINRIDDKDVGFVRPVNEECSLCEQCKMIFNRCPLELNEYGSARCQLPEKLPNASIIVEDGQYVNYGDSLTAGYVLPNSIIRNADISDTEIIRKKQVVWLETYFNTFRSNGIDVNARHFEFLARCQNLLVTVVDKGDTDLEEGETYEITQLMKDLSTEELSSVKFSMKTSNKSEVVTHFSGPMAMLTFEDVAGKIAMFTNKCMKSSTTSLIGDTFVGNDLTKPGTFKALQQPSIMGYSVINSPYNDVDDELFTESEEFEITKDDTTTGVVSLDDISFDGLDNMDLFSNENQSPEIVTPDKVVENLPESELKLDDMDLDIPLSTDSTFGIDEQAAETSMQDSAVYKKEENSDIEVDNTLRSLAQF